MSKRDLIDAYVGGRLGRREFVRGLTALGVSAGAALAYAQHLGPTGAAAAPGRSAAGFVVRAQVDDGEYATACQLASDAAGAEAALAALEQAQSVLDSGISDFLEDLPSLDDVGLDAAETLETIASQLEEQIAALETLVADLGGSPGSAPAAAGYDSVDAFLAALAGVMNAASSLLAGIAPAIENGEARQTLSAIAVALGRNAGFANVLNGDPPATSAFEQPTCP
ncbi:MAG: hypothetical protein ACRDJW_18375 [Thermomicrobiales bacterium]